MMVCQVDGTHEYILMDSKHRRTIGPEWEVHQYYNIDVNSVDMAAHPQLQEVPWFGGTVNKGDCIYIPYDWIRHVS